MYPPPPKLILQQLTGNEVDTVAFGKYTVHIAFENGNWLSFSAPFLFDDATALAKCEINEFPLRDAKLVRIIGDRIGDASSEDDGTLKLHFSNGDALVIYANDPMYEGLSLSVNGKRYIV